MWIWPGPISGNRRWTASWPISANSGLWRNKPPAFRDNEKWFQNLQSGSRSRRGEALHSFTHLGDAKAPPDEALALLHRAKARLEDAGYDTTITPYGYYNDLIIDAPGHPLARIYKAF
ncbi:MAG: threonyl-tRNA synthetase editing domain-containing protein [Desulfobacteraceae bacterium]|nr:threonyl-tRNA synthetase editing domain-containing protein [Desulfobacteraceae bacterium]